MKVSNGGLMDALLDRLAERILSGSMSLPDMERSTVRVADVVRDDQPDELPDNQSIKRTRRSVKRGSNTSYRMQYRGKTEPTLASVPMMVYKAACKLAAAKKPITEQSLMAATKRTENSIQSAIWWLRNHDAAGNRVEPSSKQALMVSAYGQ